MSTKQVSGKYPDEILAATFAAKAIGGRSWWPSPVDHVHARDRITAALKADGKQPTKANIMKLIGVSAPKLKAIANMTAGRDELAKLKTANALMADASAKGRNLAAIVVVWCAELDAATKAAKR